jgi:hypothetical protein
MFLRPPNLKEGELDDALKYTSFWWGGEEKPAFGFVLTPRTGRWLRGLVEKGRKAKDPVRVWAKVDSSIYEGSIENAVATIPGESEEEVVVVAHICHPQPSANDNASGSGAAMEAARALGRLIARGDLKKPRRAIRFTLVPEMTGTYCYLAANEAGIGRIVAALNLDMVGERQEVCGGPLILEETPGALPSYVNALMEAIYDEAKAEAANLGGSSKYALFKHAISPFSGGSDHYIYSDPTVGVPCPMFIQWPDKFYHTSWDTIDKVDPEMLRKVALMCATYAYFIAMAGPEESIWLASEAAAREKRELVSYVQRKMGEAMSAASEGEEPGKRLAEALSMLGRAIRYRLDRGVGAIRSVSRLAGGDPGHKAVEERLVLELGDLAKAELRQAEETMNDFAKARGLAPLPKIGEMRPKKAEREAAGITPRRLFRGPVETRSWERRLSAEDRDSLWRLEKDHPGGGLLGTLAMFWTDGERNLSKISALVELESGKTDLDYLVSYYDLLRKMGLVEYA